MDKSPIPPNKGHKSVTAPRQVNGSGNSGRISRDRSAISTNWIRTEGSQLHRQVSIQSTISISKQTESVAIYNVSKEAELTRKDAMLTMVMERLSSIQREAIERSFLDHEGEFDYIIAGEMHMSDRRLREIKQAALDVLIVYKDDATSSVV